MVVGLVKTVPEENKMMKGAVTMKWQNWQIKP